MNTESVTESMGHLLVEWALGQWRLREIASRAYGIYDGRVQGELLYWAPPRPLEEP